MQGDMKKITIFDQCLALSRKWCKTVSDVELLKCSLRGHSRLRLLEMASFDRSYTIYSRPKSIALPCSIVELFDLEIWFRGHSRSLKIVPFESLGAASYSHSIATMAVSLAVTTQYSNVTKAHLTTERVQEPRYVASLGCSRAAKKW